MLVRIDRFLSNNTMLTRKEIHKVIKQQRVCVNGEIIKDFSIKINPNQDTITFDNEQIVSLQNIYIAINKPVGYLSSNTSSDLYPSILELIEGYDEYELFLVGRLDVDTTGLLIITNDGKFSHYLKSPKNNIEKEYEVCLAQPITEQMLHRLNQPIKLDNKLIKPFKLSNIDGNKLNITITEGKYHEIKRIFNIVNNQVITLKRIRIANLKLSDLNLEQGQYQLIKIKDIINNY